MPETVVTERLTDFSEKSRRQYFKLTSHDNESIGLESIALR